MNFSAEDRKDVLTFLKDVLKTHFKEPACCEYIRGHVSKATPNVRRYILHKCKGEHFLEYFERRKNYFIVENGYVSLKNNNQNAHSTSSHSPQVSKKAWKNYNNKRDRNNSTSSSNLAEPNSIGFKDDKEKEEYEDLAIHYFTNRLKRYEEIEIESIDYDDLPKKVKKFIRITFKKKIYDYFSHYPDTFTIDDDGNVHLRNQESETSAISPSECDQQVDVHDTTHSEDKSFENLPETIQKASTFLDCILYFINVLKKQKPNFPINNLAGYLSKAPKHVQGHIKLNYSRFKLFFDDAPLIFIKNDTEEITISSDYKNLIRQVKSAINRAFEDFIPLEELPLRIDSILWASDILLSKCLFRIELICVARLEDEMNYENQAVKFFYEVLNNYAAFCHLTTIQRALGSAPYIVSSVMNTMYNGQKFESFFRKHSEFKVNPETPYVASCRNNPPQIKPKPKFQDLYNTTHFLNLKTETLSFIYNVCKILQGRNRIKLNLVEELLKDFRICREWIKMCNGKDNLEKIKDFLCPLKIFEFHSGGYISFPTNRFTGVLIIFLEKVNVMLREPHVGVCPFPTFKKIISKQLALQTNPIEKEFSTLTNSLVFQNTIWDLVIKAVKQKTKLSYVELPEILPQSLLSEVLEAGCDSRIMMHTLSQSVDLRLQYGKITLSKDSNVVADSKKQNTSSPYATNSSECSDYIRVLNSCANVSGYGTELVDVQNKLHEAELNSPPSEYSKVIVRQNKSETEVFDADSSVPGDLTELDGTRNEPCNKEPKKSDTGYLKLPVSVACFEDCQDIDSVCLNDSSQTKLAPGNVIDKQEAILNYILGKEISDYLSASNFQPGDTSSGKRVCENLYNNSEVQNESTSNGEGISVTNSECEYPTSDLDEQDSGSLGDNNLEVESSQDANNRDEYWQESADVQCNDKNTYEIQEQSITSNQSEISESNSECEYTISDLEEQDSDSLVDNNLEVESNQNTDNLDESWQESTDSSCNDKNTYEIQEQSITSNQDEISEICAKFEYSTSDLEEQVTDSMNLSKSFESKTHLETKTVVDLPSCVDEVACCKDKNIVFEALDNKLNNTESEVIRNTKATENSKVSGPKLAKEIDTLHASDIELLIDEMIPYQILKAENSFKRQKFDNENKEITASESQAEKTDFIPPKDFESGQPEVELGKVVNCKTKTQGDLQYELDPLNDHLESRVSKDISAENEVSYFYQQEPTQSNSSKSIQSFNIDENKENISTNNIGIDFLNNDMKKRDNVIAVETLPTEYKKDKMNDVTKIEKNKTITEITSTKSLLTLSLESIETISHPCAISSTDSKTSDPICNNGTPLKYPLQPLAAKIVLLTNDSCIAVTEIESCKQNIYFLKCVFSCDQPDCKSDCFNSLCVGDIVSCFVPLSELSHRMWVSFMVSKENSDKFDEIEVVNDALRKQIEVPEFLSSSIASKTTSTIEHGVQTHLGGPVQLCKMAKEVASQTDPLSTNTASTQSFSDTFTCGCQTEICGIDSSFQKENANCQTNISGDIKECVRNQESYCQTNLIGNVKVAVDVVHTTSQTISTGNVFITNYYHHA